MGVKSDKDENQLSRVRQGQSGTQAFLEEARRTEGYTWFDWLHGYVYARWPYFYIGVSTGEHILGRAYRRLAAFLSPLSAVRARLFPPKADRKSAGVAETYHGKVVPLEAAKELVLVQEDISLPNLEHVIPFRTARDLILKQPDHILILDCPCRVVRENACQPLDVCMIVGEPFASLVRQHHPQRSRWVDGEEAVSILREEHERGHVHHAFFNEQMLGRFYAICNCCSCCCGAMQVMRNGSPMLISSGYVSLVDEEQCIGCAECETVCPFGAISVWGDVVQVDRDACMGCGVCGSVCEQQALSLVRDPEKSAPLMIGELMAK